MQQAPGVSSLFDEATQRRRINFFWPADQYQSKNTLVNKETYSWEEKLELGLSVKNFYISIAWYTHLLACSEWHSIII